MLNKKLMILTIILVSFLAVSAVSAADNATDDVVSVGDNLASDVVSVEETNDEIADFCDSNTNNVVMDSDDNQMELSQDLIDDVTEDDNLKSKEIDEFLTANPKTFSNLNTIINGNDDSDVYLDSNYTFEVGSDDGFKDGVVISRAVTVHGNGYTIDADNAARIFTVTNSNVIFKDIIFVNGKTNGGGGAVNGKCTAVNCTFNSNSAGDSGGAMYGGSAINCTFINNSAKNGGAFYHVSNSDFINCDFINNTASN